MVNGRGNSASTSGTKRSAEVRRNPDSRLPRREPQSIKDRERQAVWGKTPNTPRGRDDMISLLEEQTRLKTALLRQARLAKLAVADVRSTEAERLRMVNQSLVDVSSSVIGSKNPFRKRRLTDAQIRSEQMIARQGQKVIRMGNSPSRPPAQPSSKVFNLRRRTKQTSADRPMSEVHLEDCFSLRGPLVRDFSRARSRGYKGSPSQWLGGPKAAKLIAKLPTTGGTCWNLVDLSVWNRQSPLHWMVNSHSVFAGTLPKHGFRGERIRSEPTNLVVLRRQASLVTRLKISDWPRNNRGRCWPNYPTLSESWEMTMRAKRPHRVSFQDRRKILSSKMVPANQVKPGWAARTISKLVLGIRADIEVPKKFLGYFRYRWGFLILHRKFNLPKPLVKWLTRQWKVDISGMFLRYPVRFNEALRRIPSSSRWRLEGFLPALHSDLWEPSDRVRKRPPRRIRMTLRSSREGNDNRYTSPPYSDKSDGGVRLN
jgi:hypothetical protein